jgi:hypothetical protein
MAELTITSTDVAVVKEYEGRDFIANANITAGQACLIDPTTGKADLAGATTDAKARIYGIAANTALAGRAVHLVKRGIVSLGHALGSMAYDAKVFLGYTDGALADATPSRNEAQTITITGTPSGGTFTLTFDGQTTAGIAYNAAASAVKTALIALSNIEDDDVSCSGGSLPGTPVVVTFQGRKAGTDVALMTADGASLTGGSTPAVTVATSTTPRQEKLIGRVVPAFSSSTPDKLFQIEN